MEVLTEQGLIINIMSFLPKLHEYLLIMLKVIAKARGEHAKQGNLTDERIKKTFAKIVNVWARLCHLVFAKEQMRM